MRSRLWRRKAPYPKEAYCSGVYEVICHANGKKYVGSGKCIKNRLAMHRSKLYHKYHNNSRLQRDWDFYGPDAFEFRTSLVCREQDRKFYEHLAIMKWETYDETRGYNIHFKRQVERVKAALQEADAQLGS